MKSGVVCIYATEVTNLPNPKKEPAILDRLPAYRKEKILCCRHEQAMKQRLGAGLLLCRAFEDAGISPDTVSVTDTGKPISSGLCFSLTHSSDMAICAIGDQAVGADIEKIRRAPEKVATRCLSQTEYARLQGCCAAERDAEFFRFWTMKESYVKMTGEGLRVPFDSLETRPENGGIIYRNGILQTCTIKTYSIPGYILTVCAEETEFADTIEFVSF